MHVINMKEPLSVGMYSLNGVIHEMSAILNVLVDKEPIVK